MSRASCLLGGPGLDGYVYHADILCVDCGKEQIRKAPEEFFSDYRERSSDHVPQPTFFGEHEVEQHCASCGEYLYGGQS